MAEQLSNIFLTCDTQATLDSAIAAGKITSDMFILIKENGRIYKDGSYYGSGGDLSTFQTKIDNNIVVNTGEINKTVVGTLNYLGNKIEGIPTPTPFNYKGKITLVDLLSLTDPGPNDTYSVFSGGSEESGWSSESFSYDGATRAAGTFFIRTGDTWTVPEEQPDFSDVVKMNLQPSSIYLPTYLYKGTPSLRTAHATGIPLAVFQAFSQDSLHIYQENKVSDAYSQSNTWTLSVPYASRTLSISDPSTYIYTEGALTVTDYTRFYDRTEAMSAADISAGTSTSPMTLSPKTLHDALSTGPSITIDTTIPNSPSNSNVPSTKCVKDNFVTLWGEETITGYKVFRDIQSGWGCLALETVDVKTPCIRFQERTNTVRRNLGQIGVNGNDSVNTYPFYNPGDREYKLGQVNEMGSSSTPIYFDSLGRSKACSLPSPSNATITFTQGGVTKGTITLNQPSNATIPLDASAKIDGDEHNVPYLDANGNLITTNTFNYSSSRGIYSTGTTFGSGDTHGSFALGDDNTVSNTQGTTQGVNMTIGSNNSVDSELSFAFGRSNSITSSGNDPSQGSACFGTNNSLSKYYEYALGYSNTLTGSNSFAWGSNNTCSGQYSCALGSSNTASALHSRAFGYYALADHDHLTALGKYTRGFDASCTATGHSQANDYLLLAVGAGTGPNSRNNVFEVWSDGKVYVNDKSIATEPIKIKIFRSGGVLHYQQLSGPTLSNMSLVYGEDVAGMQAFYFEATGIPTTGESIATVCSSSSSNLIYFIRFESCQAVFGHIRFLAEYRTNAGSWTPLNTVDDLLTHVSNLIIEIR